MSGELIVVIEDEPDLREIVAYNLEREGFRVQTAADGRQGLELVRRLRPELVVLDLMLPGLDGIEICRALVSDPATRTSRIVMLTAKSDESDVVLGLGLGADDYVTKPFGTKELIARVRAVLRRGPRRDANEPGAERLVREGVVIDPDRHEVTVDGEPVHFTAAELRLLHHLAAQPGRVFTRAQLIPRISGEDAVVTERTVDAHVRALRKKLGRWRELIETVRGVGYRFRDRRR
ncbi:MAG: DNA-binding response regulator [Planctomycetota bacterium]|nr:MAG: DNA-binding response regulator [Planctomycetota bacterium]